MSEQYSHTLIARPPNFSPSLTQIEQFLSVIVALGVVPENPKITLRIPTGKFREFPYINPFTGEKLKFEIKDTRKLESLKEITTALDSLQDFEIEVASDGKPSLPSLEIASVAPYHVGVICRAHSTPRSTSDLHESSIPNEKVIPHGNRCEVIPTYGYFTNPHTMEIIRIPDAGCARFWVQFELGKFLFPKFTNEKLEFLNPVIVSEATEIFGTNFVQGCYWG